MSKETIKDNLSPDEYSELKAMIDTISDLNATETTAPSKPSQDAYTHPLLTRMQRGGWKFSSLGATKNCTIVDMSMIGWASDAGSADFSNGQLLTANSAMVNFMYNLRSPGYTLNGTWLPAPFPGYPYVQSLIPSRSAEQFKDTFIQAVTKGIFPGISVGSSAFSSYASNSPSGLDLATSSFRNEYNTYLKSTFGTIALHRLRTNAASMGLGSIDVLNNANGNVLSDSWTLMRDTSLWHFTVGPGSVRASASASNILPYASSIAGQAPGVGGGTTDVAFIIVMSSNIELMSAFVAVTVTIKATEGAEMNSAEFITGLPAITTLDSPASYAYSTLGQLILTLEELRVGTDTLDVALRNCSSSPDGNGRMFPFSVDKDVSMRPLVQNDPVLRF